MREGSLTGAAVLALALVPGAAYAGTVSYLPPTPPHNVSAAIQYLPPTPPASLASAPRDTAGAVAYLPPAPPAQAAAQVAYLPPSPPAQATAQVPTQAIASVAYLPPAPPAQAPAQATREVAYLPPAPPAMAPQAAATREAFVTTVSFVPPAPPAYAPAPAAALPAAPAQVASAVGFIPPKPPAYAPAPAQPAYHVAVWQPPKMVNYPRWESCVPFARDVSGIKVMGNAKDWWYAAAGHYARGHRPEPGSVLDFMGIARMPLGHVAVVSRLVNSREILIDQANWDGPGSNHRGIARNIAVIDVSRNNDWTAVRVGLGPRYPGQYGSVYPTYGFIYDRPDNGVIIANDSGVVTRRPVEVAEAPPAALIARQPLHHSLLDAPGH